MYYSIVVIYMYRISPYILDDHNFFFAITITTERNDTQEIYPELIALRFFFLIAKNDGRRIQKKY